MKLKLLLAHLIIIFYITCATAQTNRAHNKSSNAYRNAYQRMVGGTYHTIEIRNGYLWTTGKNGNGQLGLGDTIQRNNATRVGCDNDWVTVAAGAEHSLAIKANGTLWAWGWNNKGQLGLNDTLNRNIPTQVGTDADWVSVVCGQNSNHSHGLKSNGTLWSWGLNSSGELGDGTPTNKSTPTQIGNDSSWTNIEAGYFHGVGLKADGSLWTWGNNDWGQIGDNTYTTRYTPTQIGATGNWVSIGAGGGHTMAIKYDGTLWTWGYNGSGQLGLGLVLGAGQKTPLQVGSDNKWIAVSGGDEHSGGIKSDGTLWTWGLNYKGNLGNGTTVNSNTPLQITTSNDWISIAIGSNHTLALAANGTLWGWGRNEEGELGNGTNLNALTPIVLSSSVQNWVSISGGSHFVGLKNNGTLWAWGLNNHGQLGDGTNTNRYTPVQIGIDSNWVSVSCGAQHTVAIKSDGTLWAWGWNVYGQLGLGDTVSRNIPIQVGNDNKWVSVGDGGYFHTVALKTDGTMWGWGSNNWGQVGDGTTIERHAPVQVGVGNTWVSVMAGGAHNLAIKSNGTLWSWGQNTNGQLGNNSGTPFVPTQVGVDNKWVYSPCGNEHSIGLKADGTLWAWGYNFWGALGLGDTSNRNAPAQVGTDNKWISVSPDANQSIGLKANGTVLTWGRNTAGELGIGTNVSSSVPVLTTAQNVVFVKGGFSFDTSSNSQNGIIKADRGKVCMTGSNTNGQLGDGTTNNSNTFTCAVSVIPCIFPTSAQLALTLNNFCQGDTTTLSLSCANLFDATHWQWYSGSCGGAPVGIGTTVSVVPDSSTIYYVRGEGGCVTGAICDTISVHVFPNPKPIITALGDTTFCQGDTLILSSSTANSYLWSSAGTTQSISVATGGNYVVTANNGNGCFASSHSITVTVNPTPTTPTLTVQNDTICQGDSTVISGSNSVGGIVSYNFYSADTGGNLLGASPLIVSPAATATYYLEAVNQFGCTNAIGRVPVTVHVNPAPSILNVNATNDTVCSGSATTVVAIANPASAIITWWDSSASGNLLGSGTSYNTGILNQGMTYYAQVIDSNTGCRSIQSRTSVTVHVWTVPSVLSVTGNNDTVCVGSATNLIANVSPVNATVTWWDSLTGGNLLATGHSFTTGILNATATYYVQVTDTNGCQNVQGRTPATVLVNFLPTVTLTSDKPDNSITPEETITFTADPSTYDSYEFFVNGTSVQSGIASTYSTNTLSEGDTVSVRATNNGCKNITKAEVVIHLNPFPNAFTPNGDGKNDVYLKDYDLTILNRWGQELYSGLAGWDGYYKGQRVSPGTYFYIVKLSNKTIKGTVAVVEQ